MTLPGLSTQPIAGETVIIRFDGDVPVENGVITDDYRLKAVLPTIRYCLDNEAKVVLLSHRGRPDGMRKAELSQKLLVSFFEKELGLPVTFLKDIPSERSARRVVLVENLRFWPEEEENDKKFAARLAALGDVYCNDAFAVSHRAHASIEGIAHYLPHVAGERVLEEVAQLSPLREGADEPYVVVMGGSKAEDKAPIIKDIIHQCDVLLLGGLVVITYLAALNRPIGAHTVDPAQVKQARACIRKMHEEGVVLVLPVDYISQKGEVKPLATMAKDDLMLDIGPESVTLFAHSLRKANTIFWNGAMGKFEDKRFSLGTEGVGRAIAHTDADTRIASGGDTVAAIHAARLEKAFTFISTGGGASLEFLAGRTLPGLAILED